MATPKKKRAKDSFLPSHLVPWLEAHGAKPCSHGPGTHVDYAIPTILGELRIHIYPDWIPTVFCYDDRRKEALEPARKHFGVHNLSDAQCKRLNPFSGKWNFHPWEFSAGGYSRKGYSEDVLYTLFIGFTKELEPLLVPAVTSTLTG